MMTSNDIRRQFLEYFQQRGHQIITSSPLVPGNDPTLLFTNAGMVQFKEVFLGLDKRSYSRATTSQRCVRAGGKHNDLENVGYTARHHTFFEMLGNFSFGDYFKHEAIHFAWDFLTKELQIPAEKLWVTVYKDDDEAAEIWLDNVGVSKERFSRCGEKDNFWAMGETGPCGPCSEIFYDHGEHIPGGPPGSAEQEADRYVEIWNLVFMQYDRDATGQLQPLPKPSVDTGMGLERIAAVMQGVHNNYDIDIFQSLIKAINEICDNNDLDLTSSRVVADHIRSCVFLIADSVLPSNEGRGYVLRRIIRRAVRHGSKLGFTDPFFYKLVQPLCEIMGEAYPELIANADFVSQTLQTEEERFAETLGQGLKHLEAAISDLSDNVIPGDVVFKLYDTYGFPVDLTADIARERDLTLDMTGYDKAMAEQRKNSQESSNFAMDMSVIDEYRMYDSVFSGYDEIESTGDILAIFSEGKTVTKLEQGQSGGIILDATPFYAESGGQVGDQGQLIVGDSVFDVHDTLKQGNAHVHMGKVQQGSLEVGAQVGARVDHIRRNDTVRNHSATHLLHAALREVLGTHVTQKGSLVAPDRLRFDFSHPEPVSAEQLRQLERLVNRKILGNAETSVAVMPLDDAIKSGAMSLFGEKYDAEVRVLSIADKFSVELCGGTHVARAGDIGLFKIINETGIASGVRRVEAVTGFGALAWIEQSELQLNQLGSLLKTDRSKIESKLEQLLERTKAAEKELDQMKAKLASSQGSELVEQAEEVNGVKVLATILEGADPKSLRDTLDQLKNKLGESVIVLSTVKADKVSLVAGVSKGSTDKYKAGELVNFVAQQVGGKGGGRPDMAQAGGNDPAALPKALESVTDWVKERS